MSSKCPNRRLNIGEGDEAPSSPAVCQRLVPLSLIREKPGQGTVRARRTRIRSGKNDSLLNLEELREVLMRRSTPHFDSRMAPGERKVASLLFSLFLLSFRLPCLHCGCFFFLLIPRKRELLKSFPKLNLTERYQAPVRGYYSTCPLFVLISRAS